MTDNDQAKMAKLHFDENVILQSKVNGAPFVEQVYESTWIWPTQTWFQRRRELLRQWQSSSLSECLRADRNAI